MISSNPSYKIANVFYFAKSEWRLDPNIFFWIAAPIVDTAAVNHKGTKTLFANGVNILFINGEATLLNVAVFLITLWKKCWNFKAVFQRNSAGIPEVNIWNNSGILMEFYWNTIRIRPPTLSKFTACFPQLFRRNTTHFLAKRTGIHMEFFWYFDRIFVVFSKIWVVFWWTFSGILMEFQSKKQCKKSYLQNLTSIFAEFFIDFLILLYPNKKGKRPALSELNWYCDENFTQLALLIKTLSKKLKLHKRKHNIFMALTANHVNTNNKSNERD